MTGSTTNIIDEPEATQVSVFHGRDVEGQSAFVVRVALRDTTDIVEFSIKRTEILADASSAFASATAWEHQLASYRARDLLEVIDKRLEGATIEELTDYVTAVRSAAEKLR